MEKKQWLADLHAAAAPLLGAHMPAALRVGLLLAAGLLVVLHPADAAKLCGLFSSIAPANLPPLSIPSPTPTLSP